MEAKQRSGLGVSVRIILGTLQPPANLKRLKAYLTFKKIKSEAQVGFADRRSTRVRCRSRSGFIAKQK
jgi:hypothetical protein